MVVGTTLSLAMAATLLGQATPPDSPPNVTRGSIPAGQPPPLGNAIIPPFRYDSPGTTRLGEGRDITLAVVGNLDDGFSYQWFKDGAALPGETESRLEIIDARVDDAGEYRVVATSGSTVVESTVVAFELLPLSDASNAFGAWVGSFFSESEIAAFELPVDKADPDNDGLSNLVEYAFALDPSQKDDRRRFRIEQNGGGGFSIRYVRARGRADVSYLLQSSTALRDWVNLDLDESDVEALSESEEFVTIALDSLLDDPLQLRRFFRLAVDLEIEE